jgi:hypothetical protein
MNPELCVSAIAVKVQRAPSKGFQCLQACHSHKRRTAYPFDHTRRRRPGSPYLFATNDRSALTIQRLFPADADRISRRASAFLNQVQLSRRDIYNQRPRTVRAVL